MTSCVLVPVGAPLARAAVAGDMICCGPADNFEVRLVLVEPEFELKLEPELEPAVEVDVDVGADPWLDP